MARQTLSFAAILCVLGVARFDGAAAPPQASPSRALAFVGVTLIDGTGATAIPDAAVVVEGERIRAAGPRAQVPVPPGAQVIDGAGRTLMPGLADLHTHLQGGWDGLAADYLNYQRYLDAFLYAGVTTILDTGNTMPYVTQIKQEIAAGRLRGPRVYCTGPMIDSGEPVWPPLAEPFVTTAQAPEIVKRLRDNHVDLIKGYVGLSDWQIRTLAAEGRKAGLRTIVDAWDRNGSLPLVTSGIYGFAHAPNRIRMTDEAIAEMVKRRMVVISTIAVAESFANRRLQDLAYLDRALIKDVMPAHFLDEIREASRAGKFKPGATSTAIELGVTSENVARLWKGGVLVAAGTDAPYPGLFQGEGLHRELELMVEAGLTPLQAIQAATGNAARLLDGDAAEWGAIAPGKRADLLLVRGAPHARIGDSRNVETVVQAGQIVDRAALKIRPGEPAYRTSGSIMRERTP